MSDYSLARRTQHKRIARDSKTRISNVALNLFTQKGIKGTTTKEIAKRAGIAEGTIYKHFKSKDDLALELFTTTMDTFREKLVEDTKGYSNPPDTLRALIQAFFDFAKKHPKAYSYIIDAHLTELKKIPKEKAKPKDIFAEVIRAGIQRGDFRNIEQNLSAAIVIGMITRAILFFNNGLIDLDYDKVVSEVVNSVFNVLKR